MLYDLRNAVRRLRSSPAVSFAAILTFGLGIGANTAAFSLLEAVLFRPFPYKEPQQLVLIWGSKSNQMKRGISAPSIKDIELRCRSLESVIPFLPDTELWVGEESGWRAKAAYVHPRLFETLGVMPAKGRLFAGLPDDALSVIISNSVWKQRLGGDENPVGKHIRIGGLLHAIIGIMPEGFFFPDFDTEVWLPLSASFPGYEKRDATIFLGLGRIVAGSSLETVQAELDVLSGSLAKAYPEFNQKTGISAVALQGLVVEEFQTALWTLQVAVFLILLLACANVANLLVAQGISREKEIATRVALGCGAWRVVRLLVIETSLLSLMGCMAGLFLAKSILKALTSLGLTAIPRIQMSSLNPVVLLLALALALFAGLAAGLFPGRKATRIDVIESLKLGGDSSGQSVSQQKLRLLIVWEVAIAVVLVASASLLVTSFVQRARADWGFDPEGLAVIDARPNPLELAESTPSSEFLESCSSSLRKLPGVHSASVAESIPLLVSFSEGAPISSSGRILQGTDLPTRIRVSTGYFQTMRIPVLRGREFLETDTAHTTPTIILSEGLARALWPGENPIGKGVHLLRLRADFRKRALKEMGSRSFETFKENILDRISSDPTLWEKAENTPREVVGVVGDVRMTGLDREPRPIIYLPIGQSASRAGLFGKFVIRTSGDPLKLAKLAASEILRCWPNVRIHQTDAMELIVARSIGGRGTNKLLLVTSLGFGSLSLFLASIGIYAVVSCGVSQRRHEIGVRVALGAQESDVYALVMASGIKDIFVGLLIGGCVSVPTGQLIENLLFGVEPLKLWLILWSSAPVVVCGLVASYLPARRAARMNPVEAIRCE